ncbi:hypothetical protein [Vogesella indigofera]|uniref:Uncharacterized protein n=1 Tax=Vogesella indigofera TaxID=45465 RepID=A0ABT5I064_VOGIN|nr:hypothetical protein [Vogesella indigofera]MDC7689489.1 hypothetical protein [Vogesella indigofera]
MTILSPETRDMLHALTWYMTARKTALRAALSFRTPLSEIALTDMRVQYGTYFQNLLSATELMREPTPLPPKFFETELFAQLVFPGFQDGKSNYEYIKYLRNAIVHRGYDITSAAQVNGDFLMLVAEPSFQNNATNPAKVKTYHAFDKYILNIITKCESVIGGVIFETLNNAGVFQMTVDPQAATAEIRTAVQNSHVMPEWAKAMSAPLELKSEWFVDMNNSMKDRLREALAPCDTLNPA